MEAWQTTCPRHAVWENALIDELIQLNRSSTIRDPEVTLTPRGNTLLGGDNEITLGDSIESAPSFKIFVHRMLDSASTKCLELSSESAKLALSTDEFIEFP